MKILLLMLLISPFFSHSNQVQLVSSVSQTQKGQTFLIGLKFLLSHKWHTYWSHPGDVGLPVEIKWNTPKGIKIGDLQWPLPNRVHYQLNKKDIYSFIYKNEALIPIPITVSKSYTAKEIPIEMKLTWFVCQKICFAEEEELFLSVKLGDHYKTDKIYYPLFKKWEQKIPQPLSFKTYFTTQENTSLIHFYFNESISCSDLLPKTERSFQSKPPKLIKQTHQHCSFEVLHSSPAPPSISGLLVYKKDQKLLSSYFLSHQKNKTNLIWFIFLAFIGGLILNIMPCVIPIIFLKVYNTLEVFQKNPEKAFKLALGYTAGVISSFLILAFAILIFKFSGEAVGWGFHLQSPAFVTSLAFIFIFMGFYLLQLVSLPLPKAKVVFESDAMSSNFLIGILSTLVASPCTVPFMAPAVGFAFSGSMLEVFLVFFSLGLGLSFPYLLISIYPSFFKYLPEPKKWMETFKKFLSIPLFLTSIWMFYILFYQLTLASFMLTLTLIPLSILVVLCYSYMKYSSKRTALISILIALIPLTLFLQKNKKTISNSSFYVKYNYRNFSLREIEKLRKQNKNIFVYLGAEWCLTCKWNEVFLKNKKTLKLFKDNNVILFYGDWTYRSSGITNFLETYKKRGVPFYVVYKGNQKATVLSSAFLSEKAFLNELKSALE